MSLLRFSGIILLLPTLAFAAKPLGHEVCVASCYNALKDIKFTNQPGGNGTSCLNDLKVSSTFACTRVRCQDPDIEPGITWWQAQCKHASNVINVARYHTALDDISAESMGSLRHVGYKEKGVFNETVVPSNDSWDLVYGTVHTYSFERHLHNTFRWIPYAFWALVLIVITGHRVLESVSFKLRQESTAASGEDEGNKVYFSHRPFSNWGSLFHSHTLLAPSLGRRLDRILGWLAGGNRLQALTILCYIVIHAAIVSVRHSTMEENIYYKSREIQRLRYVSDRLGVLMSSSLPFIWLFGTRNNFFLWASGLSFSTMQIFHRWVSLIFAIEAIIHGSCFTAYYLQQSGEQGYKQELRDPLFVCGILAATTACIMILLSWHQIRRCFYEFFKVTHILLAIVLLVAFHRHVVGQFRGTYLVFLWVCVGLWSFDHACRLTRLVVVNWPKKTENGTSTLAQVTYNPKSDVIRIKALEGRNMLVGPGAYYFLSLPRSSGWRIWEQHPFSAVGMLDTSTPAPSKITSMAPPPSLLQEKDEEPTGFASPSKSPISYAQSNSGSEGGVTFLIRPKAGMTARLRTKLLASSPPSITLPVILEGPYGSHPLPFFNPSHFSSILFVAGGTGITATLSYLHSIVDTCRREDVGVYTKKRVQLVWTAREEEFIRDVIRHELEPICQVARNPQVVNGLRIEIQLFVTGQKQRTQQMEPRTKPSPSNSPSLSERSSNSPPLSHIPEKGTDLDIDKDGVSNTIYAAPDKDTTSLHMTHARPDVHRLVSAFCTPGSEPTQPSSPATTRSVADETSLPPHSQRIAVFVCGPKPLAEEVRCAAARRAKPRLEFFEQVYGW